MLGGGEGGYKGRSYVGGRDGQELVVVRGSDGGGGGLKVILLAGSMEGFDGGKGEELVSAMTGRW